MLLWAAISHTGGLPLFVEKLDQVSPTYLDLGVERFGSLGAMLLFAGGWLFNGIGVVGQPQVMVRFMALNDQTQMKKTGLYYFLWSACFLSVTLVVGLSARLFITNASGFDPELALPTLAQTLLPAIAVGVVLGGIFAATISTVDSQILSCSAVLSEDFQLGKGIRAKRLSTLAIVVVSLTIALFAPANVFTLVILAWSALACTLGPLVIVHALGKRPSENTALLMMGVGFTVAMLWRHFGLNGQLYEGAPGILSALIVFYFSTLKKSPVKEESSQ